VQNAIGLANGQESQWKREQKKRGMRRVSLERKQDSMWFSDNDRERWRGAPEDLESGVDFFFIPGIARRQNLESGLSDAEKVKDLKIAFEC
jgi:hypothetical protein